MPGQGGLAEKISMKAGRPKSSPACFPESTSTTDYFESSLHTELPLPRTPGEPVWGRRRGGGGGNGVLSLKWMSHHLDKELGDFMATAIAVDPQVLVQQALK